MSEITDERVKEAWDDVKDSPSLMDVLRRGGHIRVPLRTRIADLAGAADQNWEKPVPAPYVEFRGRFERFDPEGGSYWVVRSGHHVVATEWVTKKGEEA